MRAPAVWKRNIYLKNDGEYKTCDVPGFVVKDDPASEYVWFEPPDGRRKTVKRVYVVLEEPADDANAVPLP